MREQKRKKNTERNRVKARESIVFKRISRGSPVRQEQQGSRAAAACDEQRTSRIRHHSAGAPPDREWPQQVELLLNRNRPKRKRSGMRQTVKHIDPVACKCGVTCDIRGRQGLRPKAQPLQKNRENDKSEIERPYTQDPAHIEGLHVQ